VDSISESIAAPRTATAEQVADQHPNTDANGNRLVGIFADRLVGDLGAGDGFVADGAGNFFGAFQRGSESFASLADFFPATSAVAAINARAS